MDPSEETPNADSPTFVRTLVSVLVVQVVALALLWLLQTRYGG